MTQLEEEELVGFDRSAEAGHAWEQRAHSLQEGEDNQDTERKDNERVEEVAVRQAVAADSYTVAVHPDQLDPMADHVLHKALGVVHFDLVDRPLQEHDLRSQHTKQKLVQMQPERILGGRGKSG